MNSPKTESSLALRRWHLFLLAGLIVAAYWFVEKRYVTERRELVFQQDRIAQALARAYLDDHGPIFEHEQALYAGSYRINWSDTLVDAVSVDSGCGVTIYQGDERIATTMAKPGTAERAIGTKASPEIKALVLEQGHTFDGALSLFGKERLVEYTPLKGGDNRTIGMIATFRDVESFGHEIAYFRATLGGVMLLLFVALLTLVAQVERQGREAARERRTLVEERAKQQAKFFESMTHELRTPLSTLLVFASSLVDSVSDDRSRDVAKRVQGETKELITVVDDILDYARIEADNLSFATEEVDLTKIAERCVDAVRSRAGTRAIRLDVQIPADLPKINGDPARVQQPVTNLLATAISATDEGRVKVRASAERDVVLFDVTDNGLGLSDQQIETVWDPFHVGFTAGRAQAGSGLALAITRGLVVRMGGAVEARSTKGKGTMFRVRFPRAQVTA